MEDAKFRSLGDTIEKLVALANRDDEDGFGTLWDSLQAPEQRMAATAMAAMIAHLRTERGDPPGSVYGPMD